MTRIAAFVACAAPSVLLAATPPSSMLVPQEYMEEYMELWGDNTNVLAPRRLSASDLAPAEDNGYYIYIGCYADKRDDRVIGGNKIVQDDMTAELCYQSCNVRGGFYMTTQFGKECFCSRKWDLDFDRHGSGVCDMSCEGNESERCGGFCAFDLYGLVWPDTPTSLEYIGCYGDDKERVMSDMYSSDDMTSAVCRDHCKDEDANYYATQYGKECWCGLSDTFSDYETHGLAICHMRCAGDTSAACGGYYAFSLYRFIDESSESTSTPTSTPENIFESTLETGSFAFNSSVYPYDGTSFFGNGTCYGEISNGSCAIRSPIPSMYESMIPVALNSAQYNGSRMCGACIEGEGSGDGPGSDHIAGSFKAYVMHECLECSFGDLDFSMSLDGLWNISWKFVPCPGGSDTPTFHFEGTYEYDWKIQPRGTKTPVVELTVDGTPGNRTGGNFFQILGVLCPLYNALTVETKTMLGAIALQEFIM